MKTETPPLDRLITRLKAEGKTRSEIARTLLALNHLSFDAWYWFVEIES